MAENLSPQTDTRSDQKSGEPPAEISDEERREDAYELDRTLVERLLDALEAEDRTTLKLLIEDLHSADIADLLEQIDRDEREVFIRLMGSDLDADVLPELEEGVRDEILDLFDDLQLAEAVKELDTDDVVYLVEDLEDDEQEKLLDALEPADRAAVEQSLQYPEETAGRLMQRELVKAPAFWTVGQTIDYMRGSTDLPDQFYKIIVIDPAMRPVGAVPLSKLMATGRQVTLGAIMDEDVRLIPVDQSQEDVAYAFNQYHLVSAPVIDDDGRLVGVITIDDAMKVLEEEAEEDMLRLAGVGDEEISDSIWETARRRFPWLAVNLLTAIIASIVIGVFDATIEKLVAVAILMPIVASMGGNAGTQTLTVAVRALATRDLTSTNAFRIVMREASVGLANGLAFAVLVGGVGYFWFGDLDLGLVLSVAMVVNMLVAGLAGILIPIGLDKVGADPALASGTFVTTVTDVVGFFVFLGLATLVLL